MYEKVKAFVKQDGKCELLSKKYTRSKDKMLFKCKCGETFETSFDSFKNKSKRQCNDCGRKLMMAKQRFKLEDVRDFIEVESLSGCTLLSNFYENTTTKLEILCACGDTFITTYRSFQRGKMQCNKCSFTNMGDEKRIPLSEIRSFINQHDCELMSTDCNGVNDKLDVMCKCKNIFTTTYTSFKSKNKRTCDDCTKARLREVYQLSYEDVKEFIEKESKCTLLSTEYVNSLTYMDLRCGCGKMFQTTWGQFRGLDKRQCNECGEEKRKRQVAMSIDDLRRCVELNSSGECVLVSEEYEGYGTHFNVRCKCDDVFSVTMYQFKTLKIHNCRKCRGMIDWNIEMVDEFVASETDCTLVSTEYNKTGDDMRFKCECGNEFTTSFNEFLHQNRRRCLDCAYELMIESQRKTTAEFNKEVYDLVGDKYSVESEYIGAREYITMKHNECGYTYKTIAGGFLGKNGARCPKCRASKGETKICEILESLGVKYQVQYAIDECRRIRPLPFDVAICDTNDNLVLLIEYQGIQHYEAIDFFGGVKGHERVVESDKMKKDYCFNNNIPLLRIPYWEINNLKTLIVDELNRING